MGKYYSGKIAKVQEANGKFLYDINYNDGDKETAVEEQHIKCMSADWKDSLGGQLIVEWLANVVRKGDPDLPKLKAAQAQGAIRAPFLLHVHMTSLTSAP